MSLEKCNAFSLVVSELGGKKNTTTVFIEMQEREEGKTANEIICGGVFEGRSV